MTGPIQPKSESESGSAQGQSPRPPVDLTGQGPADPYPQSERPTSQYPSTEARHDSPVPPESSRGLAAPMGGPATGGEHQGRQVSGLAVTVLVLGIISLVLSIISLLSEWMPVLYIALAMVTVIALIYGIVGIATTGIGGRRKGHAITVAGTVLSVVALVITMAITTVTRLDVKNVMEDISADAESSKGISKPKGKAELKPDAGNMSTTQTESDVPPDPSTAKVELRATATGKGSIYTGADGNKDVKMEAFNRTWSKTISGADAKKGYSLQVNGDADGSETNQRMSCTILVNGLVSSYNEVHGNMSAAMCNTDQMFGNMSDE